MSKTSIRQFGSI